MSEFAYVDPLDVTSISRVDFPSGQRAPIGLNTGAFVYLPKAPDGTTLLEAPTAEWDVYNFVEDDTPPPGPIEYYTPVDTLAFRNAADTGVGVVGDPTSQVIETRVWNEIPIDELYEKKKNGIAVQDDTVTFNAVDTSLAVNWWIIVTQTARFRIGQVQGSWGQRQIDSQAWPSGPNTPRIGIYNANTESSRRELVTDSATWKTIYDEITQHDQATGNATQASGDALDAAYGDGSQANFAAVAAHDPQDPAWNYPPTVTLQL